MSDDTLVKEQADAVPCIKCGRPTWSKSSICSICRLPEPEVPPTQRNVPAPEEPRVPDLDADGRLAEDVYCRRCGYNLRGLSPTAHCPECELPNSRSLFGDQLRFADAKWLRRIDHGVRLLLGAIFASIAVTVVMVPVMMIFMGSGTTGWAIMGVSMALSAMISLVWVAAAWMITSPDPAAEETEPPLSARKLARWCILATLLAMPISLTQQQGAMATGVPASAINSLLDTLLLIGGALAGLIALVGVGAGLVYLRSLAQRIPHDGIAGQTRIAGWGYVVVGALAQVVGIVFQLVMVPAAAARVPPGFILVASAGCVVWLGMLTFGIWLIVLLFRYATEFRKAREKAEQFQSH